MAAKQERQIRQLKLSLLFAKKTVNTRLSQLVDTRAVIKTLEDNLKKCNETVTKLKAKCRHLELVLRSRSKKMDACNENLRKVEEKLATCEHVQNVITLSAADVDDLLQKKMSGKQLATMVMSLKRELQQHQRKKRNGLRNAMDRKLADVAVKRLCNSADGSRYAEPERNLISPDRNRYSSGFLLDNNVLWYSVDRVRASENSAFRNNL